MNRLSPWHDNGISKPPAPEPIIIKGEEYEVDDILDSRIFRRQLQYLVKWKGYTEGDNSWEPAMNLTHSKNLIARFHRNNPGAPRHIKASLFASLQPFFRIYTNYTDYTLSPHLYASIIGYDWENGKYLGLNVSRGHSIVGRG